MTETRTLPGSVSAPALYVALDLGKQEWKLAMTAGFGIEPWVRTVASGDLGGVARVLREGRRRYGLAADAAVVSCYEAGRDGFWIHRALRGLGIANRVVDSASIEVNRRARRAKTDRLDALKLVRMLVRVCFGERRVWSEVRVPSVADEAARQVSRERTALTQDQTRLVNQMRGWLATWGTPLPSRRRGDWWTTVRDWAGAPLAPEVQARLARAEARLHALAAQIAALDAQQQAAVATAVPTSAVRQLVQLKGVATTGASVLLVVSDAFWAGETGAADRHRRGGPQARDRPLAVCHDGGRADGRHRERRVGRTGRVSRARRVRVVKGRADGRPPRRGYRRTRVRDRDCTVSGSRAHARELG